MGKIAKYLCTVLTFFVFAQSLSAQLVYLVGTVKDSSTGKGIEGAIVQLSNSARATRTDKNGKYILPLMSRNVYHLSYSHLSYEPQFKVLKQNSIDTLIVNVALKTKTNLLESVAVYAINKPETLVGKPNFSVFDFDFYEDKLLLLTAEKSLSNAEIKLSDYQGQIYSSYKLPKSAGAAQHFFHDYEGYSDILCKDSIFRLDVINTELLVSTIPKKVFENSIKPIVDTSAGNYYLSDFWEKYPVMNYFHLQENDSLATLLKSISNADLLSLYNFEYYYLPPRMQLEARRLSETYKTDKHVVAALMSGFTQSLFYEALYAPLFILNDTICLFNHHNDYLYHYNKKNEVLDSVKINYHHPKKWREWKKQMYVDAVQSKVYALFSKDGHHSLKHINAQSGEIMGVYKLKHHSAEKIKIRDGYVYYVYRPFESTQEKFLYRERITSN